MLNFRTANILLIIASCMIIVFHFSAGTSWWWLILVILVYKIGLVRGSATIRSNFYTPVSCEGNTIEKEIAITFDDGPTVFTSSILQTLSDFQAPATFFIIGKNIQDQEDCLKQIVSQGHTIGNHTFSHSFFIDFKNTTGFKKELLQTDNVQYPITGKRLKFFRPPYGVTTPHLAAAAKGLGYTIIGWTIRSRDTTNEQEDHIFNRVSRQIKPGAIILFHDTSDKTNAVLKRTLVYAKENGYRIIALEKLLDTPCYH